MKIGAKKMRYPGGDPENGPAYMQWCDGKSWQCYAHKPTYDRYTETVTCGQCGIYLTDKDGRRRQQ